MSFICFFVAFLACALGKICGMGGGVIIKPVLDASGVMSVSAISFLSGCTVIGMSFWSVGSSVFWRESQIDWKLSSPLAVGAALGGILGKDLFNQVAALFSSANTVGGIQAILLFFATLATLIYTVKKAAIPTKRLSSPLACIVIGLLLGLFGAFLGIGGGPFNMAVLFFFFSMSTKVAAQNSLYIILISQIAGLLKNIFARQIPQFSPFLLVGMVFFGILGSEIGGVLNHKLSDSKATLFFEGAMILVMGINLYNICKFLL
ncbi:MAG: sulfite exporter TauE/SafE family protein [Lachnospiraceae bacterium]|jgi:uncharacterized membrane protein YfcA|nr:sulfite exporter TauE/SafE family protein [Lachnospiraceae bacterium]